MHCVEEFLRCVYLFLLDRYAPTFLPLGGLMCPHNKKNLRLPIPCTSSPPITQIYNTSSRIHICNPAGGLQWSFFAKTVNVGCFSRGASSLMFDWILNVFLPKELFTTGFTRENLQLFLPPNALDSHQIKKNMMKIWTDPRSSFP